MARVGIYPGTFDMIHDGHVAFANKAINICNLDSVVFLPEKNPRGKTNVSPVTARLTTIRKRIADELHLSVLELTDNRFDVMSTLPAIRLAFAKDILVLLVGSDVARGLGHWSGIETLRNDVEFAIGVRGKDAPSDLKYILDPLGIEYRFVQTDKAHLSSSMYR